ncbi:MAG: radical SAM protein [Candidatus Omnitrophica bacterium]|nr:radical SAM protein [Candidatus Omnitrophota bacterium]
MTIKVALYTPPDYDCHFPTLGTPALSAFLRKSGVPCDQADLNLAYRDFLARRVTSAPGGPLSLKEQRLFLKPLAQKFFAERLKGRYYSDLFPRDSDGIFTDLPYGNNTNSSFYFCERMLSSEHLWRYLEDSQENTFLQFYEESPILGRLEKDGAGLFGISIISPSQAIASLTLALFIKKKLPRAHVTIGGQWATLYHSELMRKKELFRFIDSIIVFEGESALCELALALDRGASIDSIPNVILRDTVLDAGFTRREEDMDRLPCPDFDGLSLEEYDGAPFGTIGLTYETSRGCYWSKCAYCVDLPLPKPSYRKKDPSLVVADMRELKERHGAGYLYFGDPGLSPRQMYLIAKRMIEERVDILWWTMARLDPGFDRVLFDLAYKAGLRQINFGFESASDRVCGALDKGNRRERSARIIADCAASGIKVDLQTMLGLPGESFDDALETVDFLVSHRDKITHVTFNTYYLTPFNYIYQDPARYGIEYEKNSALPFQFFTPFKNLRGMDASQAAQVEKIYYSLAGRYAPKAPAATLSLAGVARKAGGIGGAGRGEVEFALNGESVKLRYLYDAAKEDYAFIEEDPSEQKTEAVL